MTAPPLRTIVTGAAGGIGAAIADALDRRGDRVVGLDIAEGCGPVTVLRCDLADPPSRHDAVDRALDLLDGADALINCAGVYREGGVLDTDVDDWRPVWALDLEAPLDLMGVVGRRMARNGFGRIVNVTSVHAHAGASRSLAYDVAKAGLTAATRSAAIDLAPHGVLVNAVAPGFVRTAMSLQADGTDETDSDRFRAGYVTSGRLPLGRAADPREVAPAVAFLSSRANTYITGSVLTVDGGLLATF